MNKTNLLATIAISLSLLAGCGRGAAPQAESRASAAAAGPAAGEAKAPLAAGRALVVTMQLGAAVDDVDLAAMRVRSETERLGGYVANASASGSGADRFATLHVRVPTDNVRKLRASLAGAFEITNDVETIEDVTDERADLKARLHNARVQEKRILEIMSDKTGTIAAVLEAERELARVRESIERLEAQERSMDGKIELATVHVSLSPHVVPAWHTPGKSIARASSAGVRFAAAVGVYATMALAAAAPFLLPIGTIVTALVLALRKKRARLMATLAG